MWRSRFMTAFPDLRVVMDELLVRGNEAEYHWTLTGTNTGPGGTGHKVRISGFGKWRFGPDSLIASSQGNSTQPSIAGSWKKERPCRSVRG